MALVPFPEAGYRTELVRSNLGMRLKALREHNLLYKTTAAKAADISARQLTRIEQGKAIPRFTDLLKLANLYRVSVDYFALTSAAPYEIKSIPDRFTSGHNGWR